MSPGKLSDYTYSADWLRGHPYNYLGQGSQITFQQCYNLFRLLFKGAWIGIMEGTLSHSFISIYSEFNASKGFIKFLARMTIFFA